MVLEWKEINYSVTVAPLLAMLIILILGVWLAALREHNAKAEMYLRTYSGKSDTS